jgi:hypothetical protein
VDGRQRQALGGVGVPLGVVQHLLVGPASGSLHPGRQPVKAPPRRCGPSRKASSRRVLGVRADGAAGIDLPLGEGRWAGGWRRRRR